MRRFVAVVALLVLAAAPAVAQQQEPKVKPAGDKVAGDKVAGDKVVYRPDYDDPVLDEMEKANEARDDKASEDTGKIRDAQKAKRDEDEKKETELRFDMSGIAKPASPEAFKPAFHFPPVAQYLTGTCWSFSTTSFYESEVFRLTGQKIKLSELYTVYWEYVEKVRRFVRERGDSLIAEGSEANAVPRIWKQYGAVPAEAYAGVLAADGRHDHSRLIAQLEQLTSWVEAHDLWDEDRVLAMARVILDRELGPVPETLTYQGASYTPKEFLAQVLKLDLDAYVDVMSTLSLPFYARGEYKVPDNWWHDASYHNVPLDEWYAGLVAAVDKGYTVAIGGDVSEPGIDGFQDAAVVPTFDIPQEYINQDSREFRFNNHTSEDDHGLHLLGRTRTDDGHDWFLIKDSGRSSRHGTFEGYYFYRDDFVRLKMLGYTVHRDAIPEIMAKFK